VARAVAASRIVEGTWTELVLFRVGIWGLNAETLLTQG
jgi:hypothetical protein